MSIENRIYYRSTVTDLRKANKILELKNYSRKKRDELIEMIEKYINDKLVEKPDIRDDIEIILMRIYFDKYNITSERIQRAISGR